MDFTDLDEQMGLMLAKLELEGEKCHLKHSKVDPAEKHPAINYLCQNIGNPETGDVFDQIRIPVCAECEEALYNKNWILIYCIHCQHSQWIYRPYAKMDYPDGNLIYWLDVCPYCAEIANEPWEGSN